jgi:hypothetical protein
MFTWILGVAGGCIVLALLLYFLVPAKGVKVPAVVLGTVGGLAAGGVLGILAAVIYGESVQNAVYSDVHRPMPFPKGGPPMGANTVNAPKKASPAPEQDSPAPEKAKGGGGYSGGGAGPVRVPSDYPKSEPSPKGESGGPSPD